MLFMQKDTGKFAANKTLKYRPDRVWSYSSGTSNLLSKVLRESFKGNDTAYWTFPRTHLFNPLGMDSAFLEVDAAGNFVMSSFGYATPRDWARFGLLYLKDGVWPGVGRILPEGWVKYTTTPTPKSKGRYGAHFWLNKQNFTNGEEGRLPNMSQDAYFASGYEFQTVLVIPSAEMVIVRMGLTRTSQLNMKQQLNYLQAKIVDSTPDEYVYTFEA
jgi:CubicO group peptidase (beta-lactamase class C family)